MIVWIHQYRPRSAWYRLAEERHRALAAAWESCHRVAIAGGADLVGRYSVRGQSLYERVEVWLFPDVIAAERHWVDLISAGYLDWRETANLLGVQTDDEV